MLPLAGRVCYLKAKEKNSFALAIGCSEAAKPKLCAVEGQVSSDDIKGYWGGQT